MSLTLTATPNPPPHGWPGTSKETTNNLQAYPGHPWITATPNPHWVGRNMKETTWKSNLKWMFYLYTFQWHAFEWLFLLLLDIFVIFYFHFITQKFPLIFYALSCIVWRNFFFFCEDSYCVRISFPWGCNQC